MNTTYEIQLQSYCLDLTRLPVVAYQIFHVTDGRFRFYIPRLSHDSNYATRLEQLVKRLNFVAEVRINPLANSLIVNYATDRISMLAAQAKLIEAIQQIGQAVTSWEVPVSYEFAVSTDDFAPAKYLLSANIPTIKPPQDKMFWLTWLGIYPLITGISFVFEPWLILLSLPLRTLILSGVLVLLMTYAVMPMLTELSRDWLYAN